MVSYIVNNLSEIVLGIALVAGAVLNAYTRNTGKPL